VQLIASNITIKLHYDTKPIRKAIGKNSLLIEQYG